MSTGDTPAAGAGDEREQLPPMPPLSANSPEARAGRDSLHKDLAELELRDALGGIRAVITERLRTARAYATPGIQPSHEAAIALAGLETEAGRYAQAAALLAAEIDRLANEAGS